jgi:hypothetical protein
MICAPGESVGLEQHASDLVLAIEFLRGVSSEHRRLADDIDRQAAQLALQLVEVEAALIRRKGRLN